MSPVKAAWRVLSVSTQILFFSSRRRHTRYWRDWSSDVCSSDLVDVAVAKARNLAYLSSQQANQLDLPGVPLGTAVTNRTISFGAQPFFPPGINGSTPGPFFDLYHFDRAHPCSNGRQPANANQNGIVFFPGSVPLYKNGVLVGALGISGDGVEQDDFVSAQAAVGFEAPANI